MYVTYDKYYQTPRLWLFGYDEVGFFPHLGSCMLHFLIQNDSFTYEINLKYFHAMTKSFQTSKNDFWTCEQSDF